MSELKCFACEQWGRGLNRNLLFWKKTLLFCTMGIHYQLMNVPFNRETGKQLGAHPVAALPAQPGPTVDFKTASPLCLSSTGSRPTPHWTAAVAHPHLMTFVISIPLQTVSSSSLAEEKAKSREQSLPLTLGYWLSICSDCGRDVLFSFSKFDLGFRFI